MQVGPAPRLLSVVTLVRQGRGARAVTLVRQAFADTVSPSAEMPISSSERPFVSGIFAMTKNSEMSANSA